MIERLHVEHGGKATPSKPTLSKSARLVSDERKRRIIASSVVLIRSGVRSDSGRTYFHDVENFKLDPFL